MMNEYGHSHHKEKVSKTQGRGNRKRRRNEWITFSICYPLLLSIVLGVTIDDPMIYVAAIAGALDQQVPFPLISLAGLDDCKWNEMKIGLPIWVEYKWWWCDVAYWYSDKWCCHWCTYCYWRWIIIMDCGTNHLQVHRIIVIHNCSNDNGIILIIDWDIVMIVEIVPIMMTMTVMMMMMILLYVNV